ncbi:alkaline phosphatase D family protein [Patiriisocius hiemis]|uniref:Alkaline phosphatase D family protein n=1 Tax=Patiriisocius hiemis TaxID=3075604 RepID=A0ABU2Y979_9FLAO|nr:alkaline phosphatase D family protein [Constantimarinum sp. W242]MDT0554733.1 alkaline phosphatase D family protein [Constantimarinum sp. W242]
MKYLVFTFSLFILFSCKQQTAEHSHEHQETAYEKKSDYTIVFASCSDQDRPQPLWLPIINNNPDLFIWGGDNVYADTDDMAKMEADYNKVWDNKDYQELASNTEIIGVWDDHDYGKNDAGKEWTKKAEAQQLLLDFLKVPEDDVRRSREGVYFSKMITTSKGKIKIILLDTRYFRTQLKKSEDPNKRYDPWSEEEGGTLLGKTQWEWFTDELNDTTADFTMIVSSIQFLSDQHGWEKWGNQQAEVEKMYNTIASAKAKNIFFVSGDRHMAEISKNELDSKEYPLIDFTSSGLTHTWLTTPTEENPYRISNVIKQLNFGVLHFNFDTKEITFEIRGEDNFLYESYTQKY